MFSNHVGGGKTRSIKPQNDWEVSDPGIVIKEVTEVASHQVTWIIPSHETIIPWTCKSFIPGHSDVLFFHIGLVHWKVRVLCHATCQERCYFGLGCDGNRFADSIVS